MLKQLSRYYHTLKHLKPIQIRYQLWYRLRAKLFPVQYPNVEKTISFQTIKLKPLPHQFTHYLGNQTFQFLNREKTFNEEINWNYLGHGKLWVYHLNYFDYLHQQKVDWETGKYLIEHFLKDIKNRIEGLEPYPISLRTINWIKFLALNNQYPNNIVDAIYAQYLVLTQKLEYHLLGNHLLENGFSLLFGAVFFQDEKLIRLARKILQSELNEQILDDGAHFELSPMYHVILLQRALDGYNVLKNNHHELQDVQEQLEGCIKKMVSWLTTIMFRNGDVPMVNDSAYGQALETQTVLDYAKQLGFTLEKSTLSDSGYRKLESGDFELLADVGEVGPSYQPGHAHSDTLSFVLYYKGKPIIVDRGISTYEKNKTRLEERSTVSHNTVVVEGLEQTDVWGGFRVGRRAQPSIIEDSKHLLKASHNGFETNQIFHSRTWSIDNQSIEIEDHINGNEELSFAYFHLHPQVMIEQIEDGIYLLNDLTLIFNHYQTIRAENYMFSTGFNKYKNATKLIVSFSGILNTIFNS